MPVTTWSTVVTYRTREDETKTARVLHKSKSDALKHYRRMERNPTQVTNVRLLCWSAGRERVVLESQGYIFNDDIPF